MILYLILTAPNVNRQYSIVYTKHNHLGRPRLTYTLAGSPNAAFSLTYAIPLKLIVFRFFFITMPQKITCFLKTGQPFFIEHVFHFFRSNQDRLVNHFIAAGADSELIFCMKYAKILYCI